MLCQIFSACMDNASNCDKFAAILGMRLPTFEGANARIRCFAHILNLIAKVRDVCITSYFSLIDL